MNILKKENVWVPILVLILSGIFGGLGWIIKDQIAKRNSPSMITGTIQNPPPGTRAILDTNTYTKIHPESGFFRFDDVKLGRHVIECRSDGYKPLWGLIQIKGGKEKRVSFGNLELLAEFEPRNERHETPPRNITPVIILKEKSAFFKNLANKQFDKGLFDEALENYQEALEILPDDANTKEKIRKILKVKRTQ